MVAATTTAVGVGSTALPPELREHANRTFLALGTEVEVLEPPQLRTRLAATARALAIRYAADEHGEGD